MSASYPGLVLAFIACSVGVFRTVHAAEGLWQANFDSSAAIRGGYLPEYGESWLCRYIDDKGLARVGSYFVRNPGCVIQKDKLVIKDENKFQFLTSDGGAHSYAWIKKGDVRSLEGAIPAGGADKRLQTYICRASIFDSSQTRLEVSPGTYYPLIERCATRDPTQDVTDYEILFDLYSMCDNNVNPEYKNGTWYSTFDPVQAVEAGHEEQPGELSYVCRVRKDSRVLLGKHKSSGPSCAYADGEKVKYSQLEGVPEEVLVSTRSNFFGWSPQKNGNIAAGAMHGYIAQDGEPIFICRALADVETKAPRSPGSLRQAEGVCVTPMGRSKTLTLLTVLTFLTFR